MAIKQLPFERGEDFGIRQKGHRIPSDEVMENIKKNLENDILIVKCGKSFWDVTSYPEIFEAGDEFRVEDLTSIDRKQMEKTEPPKPVFDIPTKNNPMAMLFQKTEPVDEEPVQMVRKTYYLKPKHVEALNILCHAELMEVSAMVREIFERGIASIAEEFNHGDVFAQAEANIASRGRIGKKKSLRKR